MKKNLKAIIAMVAALVIALSIGFVMNKAVNAPLTEMRIVYEENPAFFIRDMKLYWNDTVYYVTSMDNSGRGKEIGYANDENSIWHIFELKGYDRDYLLASESEDVWCVMSSRPPEEPLRQYILEDVSDEEKLTRLLSVTLYHDGTARLAIPPISSYAFFEPCYYSFENNELLIGYKNNNSIENTSIEPFARFEAADDGVLVFKSATVALFADKGARYISVPDSALKAIDTK